MKYKSAYVLCLGCRPNGQQTVYSAIVHSLRPRIMNTSLKVNGSHLIV